MNSKLSLRESEAASSLAAQIRTVLGKLKRRLREQGGRGGLSPSQAVVLLRLEEGGAATVSGLARAEGMRPQSMSSIVASLQEGGLVASASDPNDGRQTLMSLSRKGEKLLRESRAARQDWLTTAILQTLSTQEQQQVARALELLNQLSGDGSPS